MCISVHFYVQVGNKRLKVQHKQIRGPDKHGRKKASSPFFSDEVEYIDEEIAAGPSSLESMQALLSQTAPELSQHQVPGDSETTEQQVSAKAETTEAGSRQEDDFESTKHPCSSPPTADFVKESSFDVYQLRKDLPD